MEQEALRRNGLDKRVDGALNKETSKNSAELSLSRPPKRANANATSDPSFFTTKITRARKPVQDGSSKPKSDPVATIVDTNSQINSANDEQKRDTDVKVEINPPIDTRSGVSHAFTQIMQPTAPEEVADTSLVEPAVPFFLVEETNTKEKVERYKHPRIDQQQLGTSELKRHPPHMLLERDSSISFLQAPSTSKGQDESIMSSCSQDDHASAHSKQWETPVEPHQSKATPEATPGSLNSSSRWKQAAYYNESRSTSFPFPSKSQTSQFSSAPLAPRWMREQLLKSLPKSLHSNAHDNPRVSGVVSSVNDSHLHANGYHSSLNAMQTNNIPTGPRAMRGQSAISLSTHPSLVEKPLSPKKGCLEASSTEYPTLTPGGGSSTLEPLQLLPQGPSECPSKPLTRAEKRQKVKLSNFAKSTKNVSFPKLAVGTTVKVSEEIEMAETEGIPLLIEDFPPCKKGCTVIASKEERADKWGDSIRPGKLGCYHGRSVGLSCLLSAVSEKDLGTIRTFEVTSFDNKAPGCLKRTPLGTAVSMQALGGEDDTPLFRCRIVSPKDAESLVAFYRQQGADLLLEPVVPTEEELEVALRNEARVYECVQLRGDVVYIPARCWYQVIPLHCNVAIATWYIYSFPAISYSLNNEIYLRHRTCYPETPQLWRILYLYLQRLHEDVSTNNSDPKSLSATQPLTTIKDALQIFDRLLCSEFTQAPRSHEPLLEDAGFCDFCGAEIFHAAFVCSRTQAISKSTVPTMLMPCEVTLCPMCCAEGRSCLCGQLRPCSVYDFEALLSMRNEIWEWYNRRQGAGFSSDVQALTTCDIYESTQYPHIMLGAISLLQSRRLRKGRVKLTCNGGAIGDPTHDVPRVQSITCQECSETTCFPHLLASGIHSWEAAFRWGHDRNWHNIHTAWSTKWVRWTKTQGYQPEDPNDVMLSQAMSLKSCRPVNRARIRLGFYDQAHPDVVICAAYEDDPLIMDVDEDEEMVGNVGTSSTAPTSLAMKILKGKKRKPETPSLGDGADTPTKRKKRRTNKDASWGTKPKKKGVSTKAPKSKGKGIVNTDSTLVEDDDTAVDTGARGSSPATIEPYASSENDDPWDSVPLSSQIPTLAMVANGEDAGFCYESDEPVPPSMSPMTPDFPAVESEKNPVHAKLFDTEQIRLLEMEKGIMEERNSKLQKELEDALAQNEELRRSLRSLPDVRDAGTINLENYRVEGEVDSLKASIDVMGLQNDQLRSEISRLQSSLAAQNDEYQEIKRIKDEEIEELKRAESKKESQIQALTQREEVQRQELDKLRQAREGSQSEIEALKKQLEHKKREIEVLKETWQLVEETSPTPASSLDPEKRAHLASQRSVAGILPRPKSNPTHSQPLAASPNPDSESDSDPDRNGTDPLDLLGGRY